VVNTIKRRCFAISERKLASSILTTTSGAYSKQGTRQWRVCQHVTVRAGSHFGEVSRQQMVKKILPFMQPKLSYPCPEETVIGPHNSFMHSHILFL
jgi:hypothetical protein